tara:strand:- start:889 stop:1380 length:492 start_codon:yes stop_codon:yes gene_type:complete
MISDAAFDKQVNAILAQQRDLEFRAKSGYTLLKVNLIEGQTGHNMICRRPDGGTSDIVVKNNRVAHRDAQCFKCGEDFVAKGNGTFVCGPNPECHVPVVMTTEETTRSSLKRPTLIKRIVSKVMPKRSPRTLKPPHNQKSGSAEKVDMADVKRQVADALEDLL